MHHYTHELNFNLTATGKDVRLRYPRASVPRRPRTALGGESHLVDGIGDVLVTKLAVTPGFDFGSYLSGPAIGRRSLRQISTL